MTNNRKGAWSSVGKKAFMGLTGLAWVGFVIIHLLGNLMLFNPDPEPFNKYSHTLVSLGGLLIALELVLLAFFLVHAYSGITIWLEKRRARPVHYHKTAAAGSPSKKTISSSTMIYTGTFLFIFTVFHLVTFKYGPQYTTTVDGEQMRDLYRLVFQTFQKPTYVLGYVLSMGFLGFHLRHGFWSAFQSLGVHHQKLTPIIYALGLLVAIVLAAGFLAMPIWLYLNPLGVTL